MSKKKFSKLLALYLPYVVIGLASHQSGRGVAAGRGQGTGR